MKHLSSLPLALLFILTFNHFAKAQTDPFSVIHAKSEALFVAKEYQKADSLLTEILERREVPELRHQLAKVKWALSDSCAACASYFLASNTGKKAFTDAYRKNCLNTDTLLLNPENTMHQWSNKTIIEQEICDAKRSQIFMGLSKKKKPISFTVPNANSFPLDEEEAKSLNQDNFLYLLVENLPKEKTSGNAFSNLTLMKHLMSNMKTPPVVKNGTRGEVVVSFVVSNSGDITDVRVIKSVHPDLDQEAIRLVEILPELSPAKINGKAVNLQMKLPIRF